MPIIWLSFFRQNARSGTRSRNLGKTTLCELAAQKVVYVLCILPAQRVSCIYFQEDSCSSRLRLMQELLVDERWGRKSGQGGGTGDRARVFPPRKLKAYHPRHHGRTPRPDNLHSFTPQTDNLDSFTLQTDNLDSFTVHTVSQSVLLRDLPI